MYDQGLLAVAFYKYAFPIVVVQVLSWPLQDLTTEFLVLRDQQGSTQWPLRMVSDVCKTIPAEIFRELTPNSSRMAEVVVCMSCFANHWAESDAVLSQQLPQFLASKNPRAPTTGVALRFGQASALP